MAQHQKHESQMRDLQLQCEANVRELHQLQVRFRSPTAGHAGHAGPGTHVAVGGKCGGNN